jgi:CTD kinase subunit beta
MTAAGLAYQLPGFWTSQSLTEVKIKLRETRPGLAGRRAAQSADVADMNAEEGIDRAVDEAIEGMGKNDKTVRFLWT